MHATSPPDTGALVIRSPMFKLAQAYALLTPWLMMPVGGTYIGIADLLAPLAAFYFFARPLRQQPFAAKSYLTYLLISALGLSALILQGAPVGLSALAFVFRAFLIFFPFLLVFYLRSFSLPQLKQLVTLAAWGFGIASIAGLSMHLLGIEARADSQRLFLGNGQGSVARASGLNGNSGTFGMALAIWGALMLFVYPALGIRIRLKWRALALGLVCYGLLLSSSRAGMLMFGASAMLFFILIYSRNPVRFFLWCMAILFCAMVLALISIDFAGLSPAMQRSLLRLDVLNLSGQSTFMQSGRLSNWALLSNLLEELFWFGAGFKQFTERFGFLLDNSYLIAFAESGIFGFLAFMGFWISVLQQALRASLRGLVTGKVLLILVIPFMIKMMTGGAHFDWSVGPAMFLMIAALLRIIRIQMRGETEISTR